MKKSKYRFLMIGAHPDDCEFKTGGTALKLSSLRHTVKFVSTTNGDTGHNLMGGGQLAKRRFEEAKRVSEVTGIETQILDIHNNEIEADLHTRKVIIRIIREFKPDFIFTHRSNDYHPDHRRTSMLVQDSSFSIIIPNVCPLTPSLDYRPVILYMYDKFKKPNELSPDIVVDIDDIFETKVNMINTYESQVFEWLPWLEGELDSVPQDKKGRMDNLRQRVSGRNKKIANRFRKRLIEKYGKDRGGRIKHAEAFEISEYGSDLAKDEIDKYFPF